METRQRTTLTNTSWWAFNAFLVVFPLADGFRMFTKFPEASFNLVLLICFVLLLAVSKGASYLSQLNTSQTDGTEISATLPQVQRRPKIIAFTELALVLYLLLAILATIHSVNVPLSLWGLPQEYNGVIPIAAYAVLYLWVTYHIQPQHHKTVIRSIVVGSGIPTLYGILQHTRYSHPGQQNLVLHFLHVDYLSRSISLFCNADFFGTYMALVMVLTLILYIGAKTRLRTALYLVLLAVQFLALTFSSTRSAWLGWVIGSLVLAILTWRQNHRLWRRLVIATLVFLACFLVINHQSHNQVVSRASSIGTNAVQVVTDKNANYAGSSRWYIWRESIPLIVQHPLLGTGPDTFQTVFQPPSPGAQKYLDGQPIANANNAYIQTAVTMGLPALALLVLFYGGILLNLLRTLRSSKQVTSYLMSAGMFAAVICYLIQALFNIDVVTIAPLFWTVLGIAALSRVEQLGNPL